MKQSDFEAAWGKLATIEFKYRAATIHGDVHGENVRVRGDDAILIDLGGVPLELGYRLMEEIVRKHDAEG